eukprot:264446-Pyramimonas_sp.AAC.1
MSGLSVLREAYAVVSFRRLAKEAYEETGEATYFSVEVTPPPAPSAPDDAPAPDGRSGPPP